MYAVNPDVNLKGYHLQALSHSTHKPLIIKKPAVRTKNMAWNPGKTGRLPVEDNEW